MNFACNNIYLPLFLLAIYGVCIYLYSAYIKKIRIKLLQRLGFHVVSKSTRIDVSALRKLAPDLMLSEMPAGTFKVGGNDPSVWWVATRKKKDYDLFVFKIVKFHHEGKGREKEWLIVSLVNKTHQIDHYKLCHALPGADSYREIENGASFVYRDIFFSSNKMKKIVRGLISYQKQNGLM